MKTLGPFEVELTVSREEFSKLSRDVIDTLAMNSSRTPWLTRDGVHYIVDKDHVDGLVALTRRQDERPRV